MSLQFAAVLADVSSAKNLEPVRLKARLVALSNSSSDCKLRNYVEIVLFLKRKYSTQASANKLFVCRLQRLLIFCSQVSTLEQTSKPAKLTVAHLLAI